MSATGGAGPSMWTGTGLPASPATGASSGISGTMGASMLVGSISSIATAYSQSQALKSAGVYQNTIAQTNAKLAGVEAQQAVQQGDIAASKQNLQTQAAVGEAKAQQGTSGVDVGSGSAALVRLGATQAGLTNETTIRNNAQRQAWGYQVQATQDVYQGKFAQMSADNQAEQTLLSGGLQAVSGPLSTYSNYLMWARRSGSVGTGTVPYPNAGQS